MPNILSAFYLGFLFLNYRIHFLFIFLLSRFLLCVSLSFTNNVKQNNLTFSHVFYSAAHLILNLSWSLLDVVDLKTSHLAHASSPQWQLPLVHEAWAFDLYEPGERSSWRVVSFKTALPLSLTSAKRVDELATLSVNPCCLFLQGDHIG